MNHVHTKINIEEFLLKFLKEKNYEIEDNNFKCEICDISDKKLSKEDLENVLSSKNADEKLYDYLCNIYDDCGCLYYLTDCIINEYPEIYEHYSDEISEWLSEHISIVYPEDEYLNYKYPVDIIIDTGDGNYDFVLNCVYPHYNGRIDEEIDDKAAIVWLAGENGYSKKQLEAALKNEEFEKSNFLKSVFYELNNCTSHMNALSFFVELTLKEIIDINSGNLKYIKLSKDTNTGLYDTWGGAGGLLEICLEKDIVIPAKHIDSCLPDGMRGYGIDDIYGIGNEFWQKGNVIEIKISENGNEKENTDTQTS